MTATQDSNSATTGYEAELWGMADALRGSMDAAEYKLSVSNPHQTLRYSWAVSLLPQSG